MATPVTRASISFIPDATKALDWLAEHTGRSKTDIVNRAVQLYRFTEQEQAAHPGTILALIRPDGSTDRVRVL